MPLPPLPNELYRPIFEDVTSSSDLCSIALCCRQFRCEGQCILFREPNLTSIAQHLGFLDSVIASPDRLALRVTGYCQRPPARKIDRAQYRIEIAALSEKTESAVPLMKNLKKLQYIPSLFRQAPSNFLFRTDCQFQLEEFDWGEVTKKMTLIESFLPSQPKLRHIGLIWDSFFAPTILTYNIPADLCPMLDSLHAGSWSVVKAFLPGRKVTRLTWMTGIAEPLITTPMVTLSSEFRQLRYLAFDTGASFQSIACYLESLELLELYAPPASLETFKVILQHIAMIPRLSSLVLTSLSNKPFGTYLKARQTSAFARTVFASVKSLQEMDIEATETLYERHRILPLEQGEQVNRVTVEDIRAERVHYWKRGMWHRRIL